MRMIGRPASVACGHEPVDEDIEPPDQEAEWGLPMVRPNHSKWNTLLTGKAQVLPRSSRRLDFDVPGPSASLPFLDDHAKRNSSARLPRRSLGCRSSVERRVAVQIRVHRLRHALAQGGERALFVGGQDGGRHLRGFAAAAGGAEQELLAHWSQ